MCRDIANGGRRCPSHTNPVLVATRNAKRREAYAKGKGENQTVSPENAIDRKAALGISSIPIGGELIQRKYFSDQKISGVIDYTALDEDSYKEFGFEEPDVMRSTVEIEDLEFMEELSRQEMKNLTNQEKQALRIFTSEEYEWMNRTLYDNSLTPSGIRKDSVEDIKSQYSQLLPENEEDNPSYYDIPNSDKTPTLLRELAENMDSGLADGPRQQRKVYRGMSEYNMAFTNTTIDDYVDEHLKLGQEMIFDGYQSSSMSATVALGYTGHNSGLLFEILTADGVNVTAESEYKEEMEVVLPRASRYMVVGVHKNTSVSSKHHISDCTLIQMVAITDKGEVCTASERQTIPPLTDDQIYGYDV